ncbi:MAG: hypothetical protein JNM78_08710 [Cyclobacteriaceae bacterium]|nr:hypothetical protein [Cyclobacteriaceae bacterium]
MHFRISILKKYLTKFSFVSLLLISSIAQAQNYIDLLKIDYALGKGNNFKDGTGSSDVQEFTIDATVPIVLSDKNTFLTGLLFEQVRVTVYADQPDVSVYTLNLKLGLNTILSDTWSATFMTLPKISSDFETVGKNDFQLGLLSIFKKTINTNLNYKFGAYFNTELFGPFVVPLLGVYYKKNKWETTVMLPMSMDVNYLLAEPFRVGLKFSGFQKTFHLNTPYNGDHYVTKANNELGGYLSYTYKNIYFVGMIGHSIGRSYRIYEVGNQLKLAISVVKIGDNRTQLNTDFEDGFVFRTSVFYRLNLAKQ